MKTTNLKEELALKIAKSERLNKEIKRIQKKLGDKK